MAWTVAGLIFDVGGVAALAYASTLPVLVSFTREYYAAGSDRPGEMALETRGAEIVPKQRRQRWTYGGWGAVGLGFALQLVGVCVTA